MNFGFNSNVRVGGALYHVQTEDRGPAHPFLDTVVYLGGRVVYKRSTNYEQFAHEADAKALELQLHERLSRQHRDVIAELEAGALSIPVNSAASQAPETADAPSRLDLRLLNPEAWFIAGAVILEIELSEGRSSKRIGDADVEACLEHKKRRIPCAEARTDASGCATLKFALPSTVAAGSSLVVRASDGSRYGEIRFRLKSKRVEKTPTPVS
jgi:hypothetical protein